MAENKIVTTPGNQSKAGEPVTAYLLGPNIWSCHKGMSWECGCLYFISFSLYFHFHLFNISLLQVPFCVKYLCEICDLINLPLMIT